ncbi:MaoC/PaaZ C-terminal domain-containing protein [soil metagenome]
MNETIKRLHDMEIGAHAEYSAVLDADIIRAYAQLSGDHNPIHEDAAYAAATRFGRPVAHGLLVAGYVQTALTKLVAPGGVSTSYQFDLLAPAFEGAAITAQAVCAHLDSVTHRATFTITVVDDTTRKQLISGSAVVAFPKGEK